MSRRILITGASGKIGSAIAVKLASDGFDVALGCKSKSVDELASICRDKGVSVSIVKANVAKRDEIRKVLDDDISLHGAYWGIITTAGITADAPMPAMTDDAWDSVIHTNLDSFFNVVKPCIMPMIHLRNGGRIIAIASVSGVVGNRGQTNYSASKGGLIAACKSLALELAKRKITVNTVSPGIIDTDMVNEEIISHALPMVPLGRLGKPDEVAAVVSFLCSDGASYITRENINVNGGMSS